MSFAGRFSTADSGFSVGESYIVNQGVWIEVLGQMGYQQTLLIEVPAPDPHAQPELAEAVALLGQAQANLQRGHDRDAVGALRDVLEQLTLGAEVEDTICAWSYADGRAARRDHREITWSSGVPALLLA
jgi:hypothetical protein